MKKITRATLKSFIKREHKNNNLFVKTKSSFDGMVDCVMATSDDFRKVEEINFDDSHTLGLKGLWLVGESRDYITEYSDDNYIGYYISNCCGSSIVAMKRLF